MATSAGRRSEAAFPSTLVADGVGGVARITNSSVTTIGFSCNARNDNVARRRAESGGIDYQSGKA